MRDMNNYEDQNSFLCLNSGGPWTPMPCEEPQLHSKVASPLSLDSFGCATPVMQMLARSPFNDRQHAFTFGVNDSTQSPPLTPSRQMTSMPFINNQHIQLMDPPPVRLNRMMSSQPARLPSRSIESVSPPMSEHTSSLSSPPSTSPQPSCEEELFDDDLLELRMMLEATKEKAKPPPTYECHSCGISGDHYIADCEKRKQQQSSSSAKTPYQGPNESFGQFRCERPTCGHRWTSTRCFANQPQNCKKCAEPVYPYKMFSIQKAIAKGLLTADALTSGSPQTPRTPVSMF